MPRIAGVSIPENKRIQIAITYIYGIGDTLAKKILTETNVDFNKKAKDLTPKEVNDLKEAIEKNHKIEGDLRRQVMINIKRLKDIGTGEAQDMLKNYQYADKELKQTPEP